MTPLSHHQSSFENLKAHSGACQEIQSQRSITKLGPNPSQINQVWEKAASCRLEKNAGLDSTHLSAKMMAHVLCGNERILGTHLEGNTFTNSLEYAQRHLQRFGDGVYQLDGSDGEKQKAHTMAKEIQDCCLLKKEIGSMNTASLAAEKLPVLVSKLSEQINGLKTSERMLLPGGWISKEGSHAMLYEIEKRADGHLHFHLFNTGDGLSNHPHKYIKDSTEPRYLCHLEWNLGSHENAEKSLGSVLHDLLAMTLPSSVERPSNEAGADQIYKTILPKMEASGAKKVPHESDGSGWRKAQKAGVCTWESIQAWEKIRFSTETYKHLKLCTKIRTFIDFAKQEGETIKKDGLTESVMLASLGALGQKLEKRGFDPKVLNAAASSMDRSPIFEHEQPGATQGHYLSQSVSFYNLAQQQLLKNPVEGAKFFNQSYGAAQKALNEAKTSSEEARLPAFYAIVDAFVSVHPDISQKAVNQIFHEIQSVESNDLRDKLLLNFSTKVRSNYPELAFQALEQMKDRQSMKEGLQTFVEHLNSDFLKNPTSEILPKIALKAVDLLLKKIMTISKGETLEAGDLLKIDKELCLVAQKSASMCPELAFKAACTIEDTPLKNDTFEAILNNFVLQDINLAVKTSILIERHEGRPSLISAPISECILTLPEEKALQLATQIEQVAVRDRVLHSIFQKLIETKSFSTFDGDQILHKIQSIENDALRDDLLLNFSTKVRSNYLELAFHALEKIDDGQNMKKGLQSFVDHLKDAFSKEQHPENLRKIALKAVDLLLKKIMTITVKEITTASEDVILKDDEIRKRDTELSLAAQKSASMCPELAFNAAYTIQDKTLKNAIFESILDDLTLQDINLAVKTSILIEKHERKPSLVSAPISKCLLALPKEKALQLANQIQQEAVRKAVLMSLDNRSRH